MLSLYIYYIIGTYKTTFYFGLSGDESSMTVFPESIVIGNMALMLCSHMTTIISPTKYLLIRLHSSWGSFRVPVANTCLPTSSKITGRDSRFIISIDFSCVFARSSSTCSCHSKNLMGVIYKTGYKVGAALASLYLGCKYNSCTV